jgi:hypothetical protein
MRLKRRLFPSYLDKSSASCMFRWLAQYYLNYPDNPQAPWLSPSYRENPPSTRIPTYYLNIPTHPLIYDSLSYVDNPLCSSIS